MPCPDCGHSYHSETCTYTLTDHNGIDRFGNPIGTTYTICGCCTGMFAGSTDMMVTKYGMTRNHRLGDYIFQLVGGFGGKRDTV